MKVFGFWLPRCFQHAKSECIQFSLCSESLCFSPQKLVLSCAGEKPQTTRCDQSADIQLSSKKFPQIIAFTIEELVAIQSTGTPLVLLRLAEYAQRV